MSMSFHRLYIAELRCARYKQKKIEQIHNVIVLYSPPKSYYKLDLEIIETAHGHRLKARRVGE